jgi:hypothetical protein
MPDRNIFLLDISLPPKDQKLHTWAYSRLLLQWRKRYPSWIWWFMPIVPATWEAYINWEDYALRPAQRERERERERERDSISISKPGHHSYAGGGGIRITVQAGLGKNTRPYPKNKGLGE